MSQPTSAADPVEAAVAHHRAGRLAEAEQAYRAVLAEGPVQPRAAHNLAVLLERQNPDEALTWFAAAAEADPQGSWWMSQLKALVRAGRYQAAEDVLTARAEQSPEADALESDLRQRWSRKLMSDGDLEAAEGQLLQALAVAPEDPHVLGDLGFVQLRLGRFEAVRETLEAAVALAPGDVRNLTNLGTALLKLGDRARAEDLYRQALALDPENSAARMNLKNLGAELPVETASAAPSLDRADALAKLGRLDEALVEYLGAAKAHRSPDVLTRIGGNMAGIGRYDEALVWLDEAVSLAPEEAGPRYERAFVRLTVGDFAGGWDDYERRFTFKRIPESVAGAFRDRIETFVDRDSLRGADVMLVREQGVGDEIMFSSMIPDVAAEARSVVYVCEPRLLRLMSNSFEGVSFIAIADPGPGQRVIPIGSLGRLYRPSPSDIPGVRYLTPRPQVVARWAERLGPRPERLRIGLSWKGGVRQTRMQQRSLALEQLRPLLELPGCDYVSLQYGDPREEVEAINATLTSPIRLFPRDEIDDFEELAGLVENLDVVVSVQNTAVHLAGALGKPCLGMVPFRPEWRYGKSGPAMPWYKSVTLFRQPAPEAWDPVIADVRAALLAR